MRDKLSSVNRRPRLSATTTRLLAAILVMATAGVGAQTPSKHRAALAGVIRDSIGFPLRLATVSAAGSDAPAVTDDSGRFHLPGLPPGSTTFTVMRLGYQPLSFEATLSPDSTLVLAIRLRRVQSLDTVVVHEERMSPRLARDGFFERKHMGLGSFVTPERIDSMAGVVTTPAQLLRDVRGLDVRCKGGCSVRARSAPCLWMFVDGAYVKDMELDQYLTIGGVYAMEVYERPAIVPMQFQGPLPEKQGRGVTPKAGCGAIAVWTRSRAP
jgi:hypothetical protein